MERQLVRGYRSVDLNLQPDDLIAIIISIGSLLTALGGVAAGWRNARTAAKRSEVTNKKLAQSVKQDEMDLLRGEVTRLQERLAANEARFAVYENERVSMRAEIVFLQRENAWMKLCVAKSGISVPPMPEDWAK